EPGEGHQPFVHRSPVEDVVVPADDDYGTDKPAELLGRPPERLGGDAGVVAEVACGEHGLDRPFTSARARALAGELLPATRAGAKMTVGRVEHGGRPPQIVELDHLLAVTASRASAIAGHVGGFPGVLNFGDVTPGIGPAAIEVRKPVNLSQLPAGQGL